MKYQKNGAFTGLNIIYRIDYDRILLNCGFAAGSEFVATLSGDMSPYLYAVMSAMNFAVGVTIVYSGVRMILGDLIPHSKALLQKLSLMQSQL